MPIPLTKDAVVLRTDFSDPVAWESICAVIGELGGEFKAYVDFVSDPQLDGLNLEQLPSLIPQGSNHTFIFIVDRITLSHPDHPIIVVDLYTEPGRSFRVIPSEMWAIENNLTLANMDFEDFANAVDEDGIFRGYPKS